MQYFEEGNNYLWSLLSSAVIGQNEEAEGIIETVPEGDGKRAWSEIEKHFKDKTSNDTITDLIGQLQSIKIKQAQTINQFLDEVEKLRLKLATHGHKVSEQDLISRIRQGVVSNENQTYKDLLATNLQMNPIDDYKTLIRRLRAFEHSTVGSLLSQNTETKRDSANYSSTGKQPFNPRLSKKQKHKHNGQRNPTKHKKKFNKSSRATSAKSREVKCFRCNGSNHIAAECKHSWEHIQQMQKSTNKRNDDKRGKGHHSKNTSSSKYPRNSHRDSNLRLEDYDDEGPNDENDYSAARSLLSEFTYDQTTIYTAKSGSEMQALGHGKLGMIKKCKLVPDASKTLISISQLTTDADCNIVFGQNEARI